MGKPDGSAVTDMSDLSGLAKLPNSSARTASEEGSLSGAPA